MLWKKFQPINGQYVVKIEPYTPEHDILVLTELENVARILTVPDQWIDENGRDRKPIVKVGQLVLFQEDRGCESIDEEDDLIVLMHEDRFKGIIKEEEIIDEDDEGYEEEEL